MPYKTRHHTCPTQHRTYETTARCLWPKAAWVVGEGEYALLAHCRELTIKLHRDGASAEADKEFIDATACGGRCLRNHEIVRITR